MGTPLGMGIVRRWEGERAMSLEGEVMSAHLIIYTLV